MKRIPWAVIAAWLYMLSLVTPAIEMRPFQLFTTASRKEFTFGIQCLLLGWIVIVPWIANVALGIAALAHHWKRRGLAMTCAYLALGLSSVTFFFRDITPFVGCYLWIASMVAFVIGTSVRFLEPVTQPPPQ